MTHFAARLGLPLVAALSVGCTTMGAQFGSPASEPGPIEFNLQRSYAPAGAVSAPLSDDNHYKGQLFQITQDSTPDGAEPHWSVRFPGWSEGDRSGAAPTRSVINPNSGPTGADSQRAAW